MILNSWKQIASYLQCSVRTAQRLERAGMPVRRPAGHSRSAVVAFSDELAAWMDGPKTADAPVAAAALPAEPTAPPARRFHLSAELAALRQRMAECRERSNELRSRAAEVRARRSEARPPSTGSGSFGPATLSECHK